jgi:glycosyltransferase involved in cell wall biosynthesis
MIVGPLISIVVPAYNRECLIGPTLASIIAQDYDNLEIIVVDDASSDKTAEVSRNMLESSHMQWRVISHDVNKGVGAARNTGMGEANGEYILFMDSDDLADPDFISTLYGLAKDGRDVTFCGYRIWNAERRGEERRGESYNLGSI